MTRIFLLMAALLLTTPAFAADGGTPLTKGTKSYQNSRSQATEQVSEQTQDSVANMEEFDPNAVEPAAGDMEDASEENTPMHKTMRLPRKN